jgi:hypothetical protein
MAVDQERGSGHEAGRHGEGFAGVELDEDEALPAGTAIVGCGLQLAKKALLEFEDIENLAAGDEGLGGGGGGIGEKNILELVRTRRQDGGALVNLGGIEQVEDGEVLDGENFVHAFDAETALSIEEIGDVGLLESGLLRKAKAGQLRRFDTGPQDFSKVILQNLELH